MIGTIVAIAALTVIVLMMGLIFGSALSRGGSVAGQVVTGVLCLAVVAGAVGFFAYNEGGTTTGHEQLASMHHHVAGAARRKHH